MFKVILALVIKGNGGTNVFKQYHRAGYRLPDALYRVDYARTSERLWAGMTADVDSGKFSPLSVPKRPSDAFFKDMAKQNGDGCEEKAA